MLTKTEQKLIDACRRHPARSASITTTKYRRRNLNVGYREHEALRKLLDKGLVEKVEPFIVQTQDETAFYTTYTFRLKED